MQRGLLQFYLFNTGGLGADRNDEPSGAGYRKIPKETTLMPQEALLRGAVKFEAEDVLGVEVAAAVVDGNGNEVLDLREQWWPRSVYGEADYRERVKGLKRRRYYGENAQDRTGILRDTKTDDEIFDMADIPAPSNERELAWLLSWSWHLDRAYDAVHEVASHLREGQRIEPDTRQAAWRLYKDAVAQGLRPDATAQDLAALDLDTE